MSATATPISVTLPSSPSEALLHTRQVLHQRMLETGYSTRDMAKIESALVFAHIHETYLRAGYSPDDIAAVATLY